MGMAQPAEPRFFRSPEAFGKWLAANHAKAAEVIVGYWKVGTGRPSLTWAQSVEEALRFGWIDGVRRSLGDESYCIRFTPRKPGSHWSNVNVRTAKRLVAEGRMMPAGLAAFAARDKARTGQAHYERASVAMPAKYLRVLKADRAAWADFQARARGYRKAVAAWISGAKREETRERRFQQLLAASREGRFVRGWVWARKERGAPAPGESA